MHMYVRIQTLKVKNIMNPAKKEGSCLGSYITSPQRTQLGLAGYGEATVAKAASDSKLTPPLMSSSQKR